MNNLQLIIFDLDGTLIDSEAIYRKGWSHVLKAYGHDLHESEFEVMRGKSTHHNNEFIKSYLGSDELVQEARQQREAYYFNALEQGDIQLKAGALELIAQAKAQGLKLAVATSSYKERGIASLQALDLLKYFDHLAFGDEVTFSKPDPEIYQRILDEATVNAAQAIAIEDSASGMQAALAAGIASFLVPESEVDLAEMVGEFTVHEDLHEVRKYVFAEVE